MERPVKRQRRKHGKRSKDSPEVAAAGNGDVGAAIKLVGKDRERALLLATRNNHLGVVKLLLPEKVPTAIFSEACKKGHNAVVAYLFSKVDYNKINAGFGYACRQRQFDTITLLHMLVQDHWSWDNKCMDIAVKQKDNQLLNVLLEIGVELDFKSVMWILQNGVHEKLQIILQHPCCYSTIATAAAAVNDVDLLKQTLKDGMRMHHGCLNVTLRKATAHGSVQAMKYLHSNFTDVICFTDLAARSGSLDIITLIEKHCNNWESGSLWINVLRFGTLPMVKYLAPRYTFNADWIKYAVENPNVEAFKHLTEKLAFELTKDLLKKASEPVCRYLLDKFKPSPIMVYSFWAGMRRRNYPARRVLYGYHIIQTKPGQWKWDLTAYKWLPTRLQETIFTMLLVWKKLYPAIYTQLRWALVNRIIESYGKKGF